MTEIQFNDFHEVGTAPNALLPMLDVLEDHMQNSDASGYVVFPDFWDNEPTVEVQLCGHCVRLLTRCRCGDTR